jgi:hypothetical protein
LLRELCNDAGKRIFSLTFSLAEGGKMKLSPPKRGRGPQGKIQKICLVAHQRMALLALVFSFPVLLSIPEYVVVGQISSR